MSFPPGFEPCPRCGTGVMSNDQDNRYCSDRCAYADGFEYGRRQGHLETCREISKFPVDADCRGEHYVNPEHLRRRMARMRRQG